MKKILIIIPFILLALSAVPSKSEEGRLLGEITLKARPVEKASTFSICEGFFLPQPNDINGGNLLGIGYKYKFGENTIAMDVLYSETRARFPLPGLNGDIGNRIVQIGYLKDIGAKKRQRLGGGLQIHKIKAGSLYRNTGETLTGMAEYDITNQATLRMQTSLRVRKSNMPVGSYFIAALFYKL